jgi:hypothetical protein
MVLAQAQKPQPQPWSKASSFETSGQAPPLFPAQHQVVQGNPLYTRTGSQSVRLNARQGNAYLLSEALPVHKGEVLHLEAHAHYIAKASHKPLAKLATAVAATSTVAILSNASTSKGNGDTRLTKNKLPFLSLGVALPTALIASYRKVPRAYLQYALYDKEGKLVRSQAIAVQKEAKSNWQALQASELVEQDGFVRVGLVNESKTDVWFDDVALSTATSSAHTLTPSGSDVSLSWGDPDIPDIPWDGGGGPTGTQNPLSLNGSGSYGDPYILPEVEIVGTRSHYFNNGLWYYAGGYYEGVYYTPSYYYNPAYNPTGSYVLPPTADNLGFPVKRENGELYYDDYGYPYVWNASVSAWMIPEVKITATMQEKNYGDKVPFLYRGTIVIAETMKTDEGWILLPINYNNGGSPDYTYEPEPPKDPEIVQGTCEGYNRMLALQTEHTKETAAFVTGDGKVFILPMTENTEIRAVTENQYKDAQGRTFISVAQAIAADAPGQVPGQWYLYHTTFDAQGHATVTTHVVTAHIHSHPMNGNQNTPSPDFDIPFAGGDNKAESYPGVPKYILNNDNLVEYTKDGVKSIVANNCK